MSRTTRVATLVAAASLSVGVLAACSSSGGSSGSKNSTPPFDEAAAKATITTNWETFFDPTKPAADKAALVQDAAELQPILTAQAKNPQAKTTKAKVKTVVIDPSHVKATVTYDLVPVAGGAALLPNASGVSVYEGGTWKVSKATFCTLIALGSQSSGQPVPAPCAS
ncbi:MAG: hypothetical protein ACJ735_09950 [Actinomycetes bacterium]